MATDAQHKATVEAIRKWHENRLPVDRVVRYGSYLIEKFSQGNLVSVRLSKEGKDNKVKLDERFKNQKYVTISDAKKAIDHVEGGRHRPDYDVIYDSKGEVFRSVSPEHKNLNQESILKEENINYE